MFFPSLAHPRPSIAAFQFLYYLTLSLFGKMLFAADGIQFKGQVLDSPALGFLAVRVLGIRRLFAIHLYFGVRPHNYRLDERMFLVPVEIGVEEFLQGRGIAPRLLNRVGIVSDLLVSVFPLLIEIGAGIFESPGTVFHLDYEHAPRRNKGDVDIFLAAVKMQIPENMATAVQRFPQGIDNMVLALEPLLERRNLGIEIIDNLVERPYDYKIACNKHEHRANADNHPGKPIQIGKRRIIIHEKRLVRIPQQVCNAEPQGSANHETFPYKVTLRFAQQIRTLWRSHQQRALAIQNLLAFNLITVTQQNDASRTNLGALGFAHERMQAVPIHAAVMPVPQFPNSRPAAVIRDLDSDRLVNIPGEIAAIDVFADFALPIDKENLGSLADLLVFRLGRRLAEHFASQLVLVQKLTHGLLGTRPNHATRARDCKKRGGH